MQKVGARLAVCMQQAVGGEVGRLTNQRRTGMPRSAMRALAWPTVNSP